MPTSDKDRALALWRLGTMLRSNQDKELWKIGEACDASAIRYAKLAGIDYNVVARDVVGELWENDNITGIMD